MSCIAKRRSYKELNYSNKMFHLVTKIHLAKTKGTLLMNLMIIILERRTVD